jgi:hypothetical protein
MEYVDFFGHKVSKLIVGDNPITGHSYIAYKITGADMMKYYTTENVLKLLFEIEASGINTMLPLSDPYILRILKEYKYAGGKMQFIFQPYMPMNQYASCREMMELEPIGIYHQGTTTDYNHESGDDEKTLAQIAQYRELMPGVPVGLGTHRPNVIKKSEEEGWDVDFYMACMHNGRRGREGEPSGFLTGKTKDALTFYGCDRPIMLETLKPVEKPIIAFKIFAGGQMLCHKEDQEKKDAIKGVYEEIFTSLKPNDFAAMGVFQRDEDQARENVELFNEWAAERGM